MGDLNLPVINRGPHGDTSQGPGYHYCLNHERIANSTHCGAQWKSPCRIVMLPSGVYADA